MEKFTEKTTLLPEPRITRRIGTTALIFIEPFTNISYLDNPQTYLGKVDESETFDEIEVQSEDVAPSYASTREDYKLLRRFKESRHNRSQRKQKRK